MAANAGSYELLRPSAVAKMLDVSESTLKRWREDGTTGPKHVKVGGNIRYRRSDIENYIDENTRSSTAG